LQDIKFYVDKLRVDGEACLTISQTATSDAKRRIFTDLAKTYRKLADDLEQIAAATMAVDQQRDDQLFGLLTGDEGAPHISVGIPKQGSGNAEA
jgi:hypothetical protein